MCLSTDWIGVKIGSCPLNTDPDKPSFGFPKAKRWLLGPVERGDFRQPIWISAAKASRAMLRLVFLVAASSAVAEPVLDASLGKTMVAFFGMNHMHVDQRQGNLETADAFTCFLTNVGFVPDFCRGHI